MTLESFFKKYPRFSSLSSVPGIEELYDFVWHPSSIDGMIQASEQRRPAISAIARRIESAFHDKKAEKDGMNFGTNRFLKNFIGYVIRLAMKERGYVKTGNKNLNSNEAEFFKAGTIYEEDLKEKAQKFWKQYNVGAKIIKILENRNKISDDKYFPYMVGRYTALNNTALDFWPYSWIIEKHYGSRVFLTTFQIAIELERQYPGIIALSELEAFIFGEDEYETNYRFFAMIFDNLPEYAREQKIKLENAELPYTDKRIMVLKFEGHVIRSEKTNILWRISEPETTDKSEIKRTMENIRDEWCVKTFDELGLLDTAKKALLDNAQEIEGRKLFKFMSLYELSLSISRIKNLAQHISFPMLFKELARRIWRGEIKDIEMEFLSGRDMSSLNYMNCKISGLSKYIPLFKYKS